MTISAHRFSLIIAISCAALSLLAYAVGRLLFGLPFLPWWIPLYLVWIITVPGTFLLDAIPFLYRLTTDQTVTMAIIVIAGALFWFCTGWVLGYSIRLSKMKMPSLMLLFVLATPAEGTVYRWTDEAGVTHFSDSQQEIPRALQETVQTYQTKTVKPPPAHLPPQTPEGVTSGFADGLERGLEAAAEQTKLVTDLARALVQRPAEPPSVIVLPRAIADRPVIEPFPHPYIGQGHVGLHGHHGHGFGGHGHGFGGSGHHHPFGYYPGFAYGRLVPHSHFFPHRRRHHRGHFFPHGHFSQEGFLAGHAFYVD